VGKCCEVARVAFQDLGYAGFYGLAFGAAPVARRQGVFYGFGHGICIEHLLKLDGDFLRLGNLLLQPPPRILHKLLPKLILKQRYQQRPGHIQPFLTIVIPIILTGLPQVRLQQLMNHIPDEVRLPREALGICADVRQQIPFEDVLSFLHELLVVVGVFALLRELPDEGHALLLGHELGVFEAVADVLDHRVVLEVVADAFDDLEVVADAQGAE
jgi:hypothetical protein